jgi:hypothetical protein
MTGLDRLLATIEVFASGHSKEVAPTDAVLPDGAHGSGGEDTMRTLPKNISLVAWLRRARTPLHLGRGGSLAAWAALVLAAAFATTAPADAAMVYLTFDRADPQASYAAGQLRAALLRQSHTIARSGARSDFRITLATSSSRLPAEAYALSPQPASLVISGSDARGLIYGTLAVVATPVRKPSS